MRNGVECNKGILKRVFSCLKQGLRLSLLETCDKVWLICYALHNKLLQIDGYNKYWNLNEHNCDQIRSKFTPKQLNKTASQNEPSLNYYQQIGYVQGNDWYSRNGIRLVSKIPLSVFKDTLVIHFDMRFKQRSIV